MTKKYERSRVEAGKAELPKKVSFLTAEKVDYLLVLDRDGQLSVEVPATALAKLIKSRGDLKALKGARGRQRRSCGASPSHIQQMPAWMVLATDNNRKLVRATCSKLRKAGPMKLLSYL
jgi:hypothetical protein